MRILFTSDYLDPHNIGGGGRVILEAGSRLVSLGHEVQILAGGPVAERGVLESHGARFPWLTFSYRPDRGRGFWFYVRTRRAIRNAYRALEEPPDLLIHNQPLTAEALREVAVPSIYLFHSPWPLEYLAERYGAIEGLAEAGPRARLAASARRHIERRALA
ncbi:MAG: glycosyltransferase family 4 protein, partial [Planctomycetota bacterium]